MLLLSSLFENGKKIILSHTHQYGSFLKRKKHLSLLQWKYFSPFLVAIAIVRAPLKVRVALDEEISGLSILLNSAKIIF